MRIAIVYDSVFGNTGKVAEAIAAALGAAHAVQLLPVREAAGLKLDETDLLLVGSPTRGFRPTPEMAEFVGSLEHPDTSGCKVAAFDTRLDLDQIHPAPLRWVVNAGGYAAERLQDALQGHGFAVAGLPAGFRVSGTEGPMLDGELERAAAWATQLAA